MKNTQIERDEHLISAGECFMFLCWVESTMRDLIVLRDGDDDLRKRYNDAFGCGSHPAEFARNRLNLGKLNFGKIKEIFLCRWSNFRENEAVHASIERAVIFRNGFGHANIQPFRPYLLYTPMIQLGGKSIDTQNARSASITVRYADAKITIYQTRGL